MNNMDKMFCFQCQEAAKNEGCTVRGVCGKSADVANLQDLLLFLCKGISHFTVSLRKYGIEIPQINRFITDSLFMTITNANFDKNRFVTRLLMALRCGTRQGKGWKMLAATLRGSFSMVHAGAGRPAR